MGFGVDGVGVLVGLGGGEGGSLAGCLGKEKVEFCEREVGDGLGAGFMVIITSQIDSFRASMRTVVLIKVVQELILLV